MPVRSIMASASSSSFSSSSPSSPSSAPPSLPIHPRFGSSVPYCDPNWYQGYVASPLFGPSHLRLRAAMREWVEREVAPFCFDWDEGEHAVPQSVRKKAGAVGILAGCVGCRDAFSFVPDVQIFNGAVSPAEWSYSHEYVLLDELARCGSGGVAAGIVTGVSIGLPPVVHFGSEEMKRRVVGPCLRGEKGICLCITEPEAGSDVANLRTTATLSPDGKYYTVNGIKKWITNGIWADYFTVAVRTGGEGPGGVSLLLVERSFGGVTTKQMSCQGLLGSGTTLVTFEDTRVPVGNLIGAEGKGFQSIMINFNHERWGAIVQGIRFARCCMEEALLYSFKRKTFGRLLIDHPVIRLKIGHMIRQVEASQAWITELTAQMVALPFDEAQQRLGGPLALAKAQVSTTYEFCAREAAQIFGGLAYSRGGQGEKVERLYREVRALAIVAGSEEIMLDLGVREMAKQYKQALIKSKQQQAKL